MKLRTRLVAAAAAALLLAACGGTDEPDTGTTEPTAAPTTTDAPTDGAPGGSTSPDAGPTGESAGAAGGTQPATVALTLDGQGVPVASACSGADGAVLATTEGEVTITLVREEGIALRYSGEGMSTETSDVAVEEIGASTLYRATLQSEEIPAVEVVLELGDTSVLEDCRA